MIAVVGIDRIVVFGRGLGLVLVLTADCFSRDSRCCDHHPCKRTIETAWPRPYSKLTLYPNPLLQPKP